MKNILVITGASSGMGKEFALQITKKVKADEVWVMARTLDKLEELKTILPLPVVPIAIDLSDMAAIQAIYLKKLEEEKPNILILANFSGYGLFGHVETIDTDKLLNMVDLDVKADLALINDSLPYMKEGSKILNLISTAAYQPIPYINGYAASKAFMLSYSLALNEELKYRKIHVLAVTPFWVRTNFFKRAIDPKTKMVVTKYTAMYDPKKVMARAIHDLYTHKAISCYGFVNRFQRMMVMILPKSVVMHYWMRQQKLDGTPEMRK